MVNRRALIEGLNPEEGINADLAEEFITGRKPRAAAEPSVPIETPALSETKGLPAPLRATVSAPGTSSPLTGVGRVPVGARVRTELAADLKRASLERQLQGIQPNTVQEILEEALELWLHKHGLLR